MHKDLQTFIKDNKEYINNNQWYNVFDSWISFADYVYPIESSCLEELLNMFKTAGIIVNMNERKQVIVDAMCDLVKTVINDRDNWSGDNIPFSYIYGELPSVLLFTEDEIFNFIPEVANQLGMKTRNGGILL